MTVEQLEVTNRKTQIVVLSTYTMMEIKKIIDNGELNNLKEKVNNGFDLTLLLEDDSTILHYAANQGQDDIISYLRDHGLDIEAESK
ncbi:hypothetical protein [Formosa sp. PL04]|uniref:hypothetical protein n=1 Tax=Formosa sp. PL04 TaxID=3081755 RepID=UPI0029823E02|nr:hypothetical protein [Formosa sp. PL04]MDW5290719.1 hypothetical protein [Formosa sp. PL04]